MISKTFEWYVESWKIVQKHAKLFNVCCQWESVDTASSSESVEK